SSELRFARFSPSASQFRRHAEAENRDLPSRAPHQEIANRAPDRAPIQPSSRASRKIANVHRINAILALPFFFSSDSRPLVCTGSSLLFCACRSRTTHRTLFPQWSRGPEFTARRVLSSEPADILRIF